ncbi:hypothetical protein ABZV75_24085 [Streptomyces flaveolus]|uniref:hypothetical protein n=1 Tax=Streptomyces flaveolus TaxID=67297 RepID=UPI0033AF160E
MPSTAAVYSVGPSSRVSATHLVTRRSTTGTGAPEPSRVAEWDSAAAVDDGGLDTAANAVMAAAATVTSSTARAINATLRRMFVMMSATSRLTGRVPWSG